MRIVGVVVVAFVAGAIVGLVLATPGVETETVVETVEVTPDSCSQALGIASDAFGRLNVVMQAGARGDIEAFVSEAGAFEDWAAVISDDLSRLSDDCRG